MDFTGLSFGDYETVATVIEQADLGGLRDIKNLMEVREAQINLEKKLAERQEEYHSLRRCNEWDADSRCELDRWHDGRHTFEMEDDNGKSLVNIQCLYVRADQAQCLHNTHGPEVFHRFD